MSICFGEVMVAGDFLLTDKDRALLLRVNSLLEELLETLDVLEDEEAMNSIREAEEDVNAGRVRDYTSLLRS